jgi:hypothetical protein
MRRSLLFLLVFLAYSIPKDVSAAGRHSIIEEGIRLGVGGELGFPSGFCLSGKFIFFPTSIQGLIGSYGSIDTCGIKFSTVFWIKKKSYFDITLGIVNWRWTRTYTKWRGLRKVVVIKYFTKNYYILTSGLEIFIAQNIGVKVEIGSFMIKEMTEEERALHASIGMHLYF